MDQPVVPVPPDDRVALESLSLLSNKWEPVVIVILLESGSLRFGELERTIPDISSNMLSKTLESLSEHGLVDRRVLSESPLSVTYELTDAGEELRPVFDSLATWGDEHIDSVCPTVVLGDRDRRLAELYGNWLQDRFDTISVSDQEQLRRTLAETPDVVVFDMDLWAGEPAALETQCPDVTRRVALVGDRPTASLCAWPCDEILRKPLVEDELITAVARQVERLGQPEAVRERESIESKLSLLESIHSKPILEADERVERLYDRLIALETEVVRET
ncbi:winged helix-turn-helix transcriptional regulator [Natrarchaeobius sp. A-rgal3]|uniref:winged helix-turn-helix transcriptional regulator n=1 Tax=Natrarchaeobius versutus TaxID=1679078 RepID=UPI00350F302D